MHGAERAGHDEVVAAAPDDARARGCALGERANERRLADPRLAGDQHDGAPCGRVGARRVQHVEQPVALEQRDHGAERSRAAAPARTLCASARPVRAGRRAAALRTGGSLEIEVILQTHTMTLDRRRTWRRLLAVPAAAAAIAVAAVPASAAATAPLATPTGFQARAGAALPTAADSGRVVAFSPAGPVAAYTAGGSSLQGLVGSRPSGPVVYDGTDAFGYGPLRALQRYAVSSGRLGAGQPLDTASGVFVPPGELLAAVRGLRGSSVVFARASGGSLIALRVFRDEVVQVVDLKAVSARRADRVAAGVDARGALWLAVQRGSRAIELRRLDANKLKPLSRRVASGSAGLQGQWRMPCARDCRLVYLSGRNVRGARATIWSLSTGGSRVSAGEARVRSKAVTGSLLASFDGAGRLWLAYGAAGDSARVRRGDSSGRGGAARPLTGSLRHVVALQGVGSRAAVVATASASSTRSFASAVIAR